MAERWREELGRLQTLEPSADLWDRAVRQHETDPRVDGRERPASRLPALVIAGVVGAVGLFAAFEAFGRGGTTPPVSPTSPSTTAVAGLVTYLDPPGQWTIDYPASFQFGRVPSPPPNPAVLGYPTIYRGVWVANFRSPAFDRQAQPVAQVFPSDGVLVEIYQSIGNPGIPLDERDSRFPVIPRGLSPTPSDFPEAWRGVVWANGEPYTIWVRFGAAASTRDRGSALDVVSSLRFLPLVRATAIGTHLTFWVLSPATDYPVGSVTRFELADLPPSAAVNSYALDEPAAFYLIHDPNGFYAVAWPDTRGGKGYKDCDLTFDASAGEFSCPSGARWDIRGNVLAKPDTKVGDDPLEILVVRISLDGHVLVSPNVLMDDPKRDFEVTGP